MFLYNPLLSLPIIKKNKHTFCSLTIFHYNLQTTFLFFAHCSSLEIALLNCPRQKILPPADRVKVLEPFLYLVGNTFYDFLFSCLVHALSKSLIYLPLFRSFSTCAAPVLLDYTTHHLNMKKKQGDQIEHLVAF